MREAKIGNGDLIQWFLVKPKEENGNEWKKRMESIHFIHHNALLCFLLLLHIGGGKLVALLLLLYQECQMNEGRIQTGV
jgi:hypothetical protein